MDTDEGALVGQCLTGDQEACTELVDRYVKMVGTVIWRATGNRDAVEDLVQETFMRVFRALPYFDGRARLSTWIYTIAHRVAIDYLRKAGRYREETSDVLEEVPSVTLNPERAFAQEETARFVREGLAQLPDKYRLALVYAAIEELDYPAIAAMLGVPLGTVKTLIFRGKRMLRDRILMMDMGGSKREVTDAL